MVVRAASALGQEVGKAFEAGVLASIRHEVEARGYSVRPARLKNGTGNEYQIDVVVFDSNDRPVIIIDPKYIRYKKHNRDKGSWLCTAHYNLRKTFPSIRKSIAALAGNWSDPSKALIRSFGIELLEVPFAHMCGVLQDYGVEFDWPENRGEPVARKSLRAFSNLSADTKEKIGSELVSEIVDALRNHITQVLDTSVESMATRVEGIEILLKTSQGEMVLSSFENVPDAMRALTDLVSDSPDIRAFIQSG